FKRRMQAFAWGMGAVLVASLPFVWGEYPVVPPLPAAIKEAAVPGKVTVVAFTDFQCPYCRKMSPVLHEIQDTWGDRMTIVRKMVPLTFHPGAQPAAYAYVCTPEAKREEMAQRLYGAPDLALTREGTIEMATNTRLDLDAFKACLDAPATKAAVDADRALFDALDVP